MIRNVNIDNSNAIDSLTKNVVQKAISSIENNKTLMAQHFIMAGLFDEVIKLAEETTDEFDLEFEYQVINALRQKMNIQLQLSD